MTATPTTITSRMPPITVPATVTTNVLQSDQEKPAQNDYWGSGSASAGSAGGSVSVFVLMPLAVNPDY